jgi:serine phosphatase RsbU (regulator of sigma subunit)
MERASSEPFGEERRKQPDRRRHGYLSRLQLFAAIPYHAAEAVLAECSTREVPAGAVLLSPGEVNSALHLLVSGRLRIHLDDLQSADFIAIEEGDCYGELSIIDGRPASAYVVADVASRIIDIGERVFWERLAVNPGVARNLLRVLSERMRHNRDLILERMQDKLALEHLQKELRIAQDIQLSMLPQAPLFAASRDVEAEGRMEPAREVGGDLYDAFFVTPTRLFITVGDVSGKGMPAALFMVRAITQLRLEATRHADPGAVLEAVNAALCESNSAGMFVTLFCGVLDAASGELSYANAGHNPPLLAKHGEAEFLPVSKGIVAGIIDNARYATDRRRLTPDETLLVYSDGVTEAMNPEEAFYGEERLLQAARRFSAAWGKGASGLVNAVRDDVAAFTRGAPPADDITLLGVRYLGGTRPT